MKVLGDQFFLVLSSGSGVKRSHESFMSDEEEQPVTRARISVLTAGLHGVNAAEDDEVSNGDAVTEEWLASWYPETHMSQKMVIDAKLKEMERFTRMKVYRVVTRESMRRYEEGKIAQYQVGNYKQRNRRRANCQSTSCGTRVQHWRQTW